MNNTMKAERGKVEVGYPVSFILGGKRIRGVVVEDHGPLWAQGKHVYRVAFSLDPLGDTFAEVPEDELTLERAPRATAV